MNKQKIICEMEITLKCIGGKYKVLILEFLLKQGTKRFSEIKNYIQGISQKTLTNQLRELESDGLIERKTYPEIPPKVEYKISNKGESLRNILDAMCDWGYQNFDPQKYEIIYPQCDNKNKK